MFLRVHNIDEITHTVTATPRDSDCDRVWNYTEPLTFQYIASARDAFTPTQSRYFLSMTIANETRRYRWRPDDSTAFRMNVTVATADIAFDRALWPP